MAAECECSNAESEIEPYLIFHQSQTHNPGLSWFSKMNWTLWLKFWLIVFIIFEVMIFNTFGQPNDEIETESYFGFQ